jgi:hypothetical protein
MSMTPNTGRTTPVTDAKPGPGPMPTGSGTAHVRTDDLATRSDVDASASTDPDVIEKDIEHTRERLGDTVEALAGKLDVKSQMREKGNAVRARTRDLVDRGRTLSRQTRTQAIAGGAAAVAAAVGVVAWRRRAH